MLNALRHQRLWHIKQELSRRFCQECSTPCGIRGCGIPISLNQHGIKVQPLLFHGGFFCGTLQTRPELNLFSLTAENYATSLSRQNQAVFKVRGFISSCRFNGGRVFFQRCLHFTRRCLNRSTVQSIFPVRPAIPLRCFVSVFFLHMHHKVP